MDENSPPGTAVGKPVKASDTPGEILTYTLNGTGGSSFDINPATGQIMVGARITLDEETGASYSVDVTATDPWGTVTADAVTVTITINDVNEAPTITGGVTRIGVDENTAIVTAVSTYTATDVDQDISATPVVWSVSGADAGDFSISNVSETEGQLTFKKIPNFEMPADAGMDNMYMVTVVATDDGVDSKNKMTATRDVVITVTNADDAGTITFSSVQPKVGIPFMATLTDPDVAMPESVKWQWYNGNPDDDDDGEIDADAAPIAKAKSDTYTPKRADLDADGPDGGGTDAVSLYVRATYTDSKGSTSAVGMAANLVVVNEENRAPEFKLNDKVITATTRMVAENTDALSTDDNATDDPADNIGTVVMATDMSGTTNDTLTYTLGGRDAALFRVRSDTGLIEVGTGTELDYETKKSYMVEVTATDPSQLFATIDVTINVADVNEPPDIAGEDDLTEEFRENSTSTIETFRATDPERRPVYWSLKSGDSEYPDNAFFTISSSGALSFNEGRDFEAPAADGTDNTYKVVVIASDDAPNIGTANTETANSSERKFTVLVTNVTERGSVTVNRSYPQIGVGITATLMDGDATSGQINDATWIWYKGTTAITGATSASYTPTESGSHKVEATYIAKGDTRKASSTTISVRATPASNTEPAFPNASEARSVDENKANANVGVPIVATDSDSGDRGKLTYTVSPNTDFSITNNGQLKTKMALNAENPPTLSLSVTATDPSGTSGTNNPVTVTVTAQQRERSTDDYRGTHQGIGLAGGPCHRRDGGALHGNRP